MIFFMLKTISVVDSPLEFLFALPWIIHVIIFSFYYGAVAAYQVNYLTLICFYFKLKLAHINRMIDNCNSSRRLILLAKELNKTHLEITKCNSLFWSKYLAIVFLFYLITFDLCVYFSIYNRFEGNSRILVSVVVNLYSFGFMFPILSMLIIGPSIVAREADRSHKLMRKSLIEIEKERRLNKMNKIKVFFLFLLI
jgi:hypothetical protein